MINIDILNIIMEENYIIEKVKKEDLPVLAEIEKECIPNPWSISSFEAEFAAKGAVFLAARDNSGLICGFITASSVLDEVSINNVAVSKKYRRQGIASMLLNALWDEVSSFAAFCTLEVRESNIGAVKLYEKMGYKKVGVRKEFYKNPTENGVIMTRYTGETLQ
jgi:ribosomal-protein-alanine N-acetyltransferase